jgi:hypothetical protein
MNEDELVAQSEANINGKRKLLSFMRMAKMLGSDLPVSNIEMQEEVDEMMDVLSTELSLHDRLNPPPPPPKPFNIATWVADDDEE